jgi:hypothetical protein
LGSNEHMSCSLHFCSMVCLYWWNYWTSRFWCCPYSHLIYRGLRFICFLNLRISSFNTISIYMVFVSLYSNTMGATYETGTAYPFTAHPRFLAVLVCCIPPSLVFCVVLSRSLLVLLSLFFVHCASCSIYGFWLTLWCLHSFLETVNGLMHFDNLHDITNIFNIYRCFLLYLIMHTGVHHDYHFRWWSCRLTVTRRVSLVEQWILTLSNYPGAPPRL